jgi:dihydropteroate synthase
MHTRGRPQEWRTQPALVPSQVLPFVLRDLEARVNAALAAGIARPSIVLDPGFGFGKILDENYPLLARLDQLHALGFPILAGLSRKSFLTRTLLFAAGGAISGEPRAGATHLGVTDEPGAPHLGVSSEPAPRGERLDSEMWDSSLPTTVANTAAILAGAHILRVHDVRPARQTAVLADRLIATSS